MTIMNPDTRPWLAPVFVKRLRTCQDVMRKVHENEMYRKHFNMNNWMKVSETDIAPLDTVMREFPLECGTYACGAGWYILMERPEDLFLVVRRGAKCAGICSTANPPINEPKSMTNLQNHFGIDGYEASHIFGIQFAMKGIQEPDSPLALVQRIEEILERYAFE